MNFLLADAPTSVDYGWLSGTLIAIATVIGGAILRIAYTIGNWAGPRVNSMIEKHGDLVTTLSEQSKIQSKCLETLAEGQKIQHAMISEMHHVVVPK